MKRFRVRTRLGTWLLLLLSVVSFTAGALAQTTTATIDVSEIHPGMRGYGLTVFRGTEPERFDVEVIDIVRNFRPAQDLILVRTPHPVLDHVKIVAGMSGSPIFFNDRLAGAYAYGWTFGKDPVAGVTPIRNMLAEMARPLRPGSFPLAQAVPMRASTATVPSASRFAGMPALLSSESRLAPDARLRSYATQSASALSQTATPILLGGFSDRTNAWLSESFRTLGLEPLQAGGASSSPTTTNSTARFVDGGAIGVQLVRGDVSATAVGTVTHVVGNQLVGFGHPMLNGGEVGLPTAVARVIHVFASQSRSFKIAEAIAPLGILSNDRQAAIVVKTDQQAATIPVKVTINGVPGLPKSVWNMEVASHRALTPALVFAAINNALDTSVSDRSAVVVTAKSSVLIHGHARQVVEDTIAVPGGAADQFAMGQMRLFSLIDAAYGNPFEETRIEGVELELNVKYAREYVEVRGIESPVQEVEPGTDASLLVSLRQFGGRDEPRVVRVHIPFEAAGSDLEISVGTGSTVTLETPEPQSLDDLLALIRRGYANTSLVVSVKLPSRGLRYRSDTVAQLPRSVLDALQSTSDSAAPIPFVSFARTEIPTGHVVFGSAQMKLRVRDRARHR